MDIAMIEERIKVLRERRMHLPEIRDYKVQARKPAKAKDVTPVGDVDATSIFAKFFKEEPGDGDSGGTDKTEPSGAPLGAGESIPGSEEQALVGGEPGPDSVQSDN